MQQSLSHHLAHMELNNLKIAEDKSFSDVARYMFTTVLGLALPATRNVKSEYRSLYAQNAPDVSTVVSLLKSLLLGCLVCRPSLFEGMSIAVDWDLPSGKPAWRKASSNSPA